MPIDPLAISEQIQSRFRRYLETTFPIPAEEASLREQFRCGIRENGRHFRGPYLHGLAPYVRDRSVADLVREGVLPPQVTTLPLLAGDRPLYRHQVEAIARIRQGRNVIASSGTGSGKALPEK
jgi:ATP-dependent helicase YprA (DUF1998 family)